MKLKDKVAIIAGGTKGIGLGIALEYARAGAKVVVGGSTEKNGQAAVEEIKAAGGECLFVKCDVSRLADVDNIIEQTVNSFGRLDIYVANAGINDANKTHFLDITPEQYDRIMAVNLKGMFFGGQKAARQMIDQGDGGVIINMSSVNAYLALDSQVVYTVSKGGIHAMWVQTSNSLTPYCHVRRWDASVHHRNVGVWRFSWRARTPTLFSASPFTSMAAGGSRLIQRLDTKP
jgi:NAD(P)-dependent dehydrogenase (short-subunit alcohol dehydrogenase family)